ncbi:hypothetical protein PLESTM_000179000 [Pleodorina starrii]|nr:hypothetical protein PLESTM_000179000 [Pleodorina starrii]
MAPHRRRAARFESDTEEEGDDDTGQRAADEQAESDGDGRLAGGLVDAEADEGSGSVKEGDTSDTDESEDDEESDEDGGQWGLPVPRPVELFMCIGKAIHVPYVDPRDPAFERQVDETLEQVRVAYMQMYERCSKLYGWTDRPLEVL